MNPVFFFTLLAATITLGAILIFALLTSKHKNKTANYLLSGLIVLFGYYALVKILSNTEVILQYPHFIKTYRPIFILGCVAMYFYCKALTSENFKFRLPDTLHLVPFGIYTLSMLPFFFADSTSKIASLSMQPFTSSWIIERSFWTIVFIFYFGASYKIISRYQQRLKNNFSNIEKIKLNWLKTLLLTFGLIWLAALIRFLTAYGKVGYENKLIVPILLCLTIFLIAVYALRQPEIFSDRWDKLMANDDKKSIAKKTINDSSNVQIKPSPKYKYSSLTQQEITKHKENLVNYLEQEKPYINSDLQLQHLADYLHIPSYQLSQVINTELKLNFYDLINSLRITEAKQQLIDPTKQHIKIITIAYDVGFNSKSTFNTAFKKHVNMTPSQFRQTYKVI